MPELPEVTGFKRYLDSFGLRQRIRKTSVLDGRILDGLSARQLQARLRGAELECTTRHGKYVFARVSRGGWLVLHFGMSGHLRYYGRDADGPPRFARVIWSFDNGSHLAYLSPRMLGWETSSRSAGPVPWKECFAPGGIASTSPSVIWRTLPSSFIRTEPFITKKVSCFGAWWWVGQAWPSKTNRNFPQ